MVAATRRKRGHGEGSIYQCGDGRWVAAISLADGRRRYLYAATRRAVLEKKKQAERDLERGVVRGRQTVEQFLTRWVEETVRPTRNPRTYEAYEIRVRRHIIPKIGHIPLAQLTPQHVQDLQRSLLDDGLATTTVIQSVATLRTALAEAERWGLVPRNVAGLVRRPRPPRKEIPALSVEGARAVLAAIRGDRYEGIIKLALLLGLRQGEVLGLRWADIDLVAGQLHIRQQMQRVPRAVRTGPRLQPSATKTEGSARTLPLPDAVRAVLDAQRERQTVDRLLAGETWQDSDLVFTTRTGRPVYGKDVTVAFHKRLRQAGLPDMKFHDLRHGHASLMLAHGVHPRTAMAVLGHTDLPMTFLYSHADPSVLRDAVDRINNALDDRP